MSPLDSLTPWPPSPTSGLQRRVPKKSVGMYLWSLVPWAWFPMRFCSEEGGGRGEGWKLGPQIKRFKSYY